MTPDPSPPGSDVRPSVIICAYTEDRWDDLCAAVGSVRNQSVPAHELIVVIDHNDSLLTRARAAFADAQVLANRHEQGLSGARNTGVEIATGDVVVFLDDDARADRDWLARLLPWFDDPNVGGVGGLIEPAWDEGRPRAFPGEFNWVIGCSYTGLPEQAGPVRTMLGANMSFRRAPVIDASGFVSGIGRIGTNPLGCEETELCIRMSQRDPRMTFIFEPAARVQHRVPRARTSWRYFVRRCCAEGRSKAQVDARVGRRALETERVHAAKVLPRGVLRELGAALRGDIAGLWRAAAIVVGLAITALGYAAGKGTERAQAKQAKPTSPTRSEEHVRYDVHGIVGISVEADAPTAPLLAEMLEAFATDSDGPADLRVTGVERPLPRAAAAEHAFRYTEDALQLPHAQVRFTDDGTDVAGRGELLTTVIPLLDHLLVARGAAMIHAATLAYNGEGIAIGAWGGSGKTSTVAKFTARDGGAFMGDDWAMVSAAGDLLGYAKPMFMKAHHRALYPDLFSRKRKPLVPARILPMVNKVATAVHPVITKRPRLARITRRWSPEHWVVSPTTVFPADKIARRAPLRLGLFLDRYEGDEVTVEERTPAWLASRLVANFHAELPRQSQELLVAMASANLLSLEGFFGDKAAVIEKSLSGIPCYVLRVPIAWGADQASDAIVAQVVQLAGGSAG